MNDSVCIIILGIEVSLSVKDLSAAQSLGTCSWTHDEIALASKLKNTQVMPFLCHEIAHYMYNKTRDFEGAGMSSEDFSTLSEHWAGIIPQINMLHFEFSDDGTLEDIVQLHEVEDMEN